MSRPYDVLTAIKSRLAGINATGDYVHDLSTAGRVQVGEPVPGRGPSAPCAYLWLSEFTRTYADLGSHRLTMRVTIELRLPAAGDTGDARQAAACAGLSDLRVALDVSAFADVCDMTIEGAVLDGVHIGAIGDVVIYADVVAWQDLPFGEGA